MRNKTEDDAKQLGMFKAASKNMEILKQFQAIAIEIGTIYGNTVTIETVRGVADQRKIEYTPGNWMGSVFKVKGWKWTGRMLPSLHKGSHSRMTKEWEWIPI